MWVSRAWRDSLAQPGPPSGYPSQVSDQILPAGPPAEITHLVRERMEARARRDWAAADALKAQIEAAGWRVVDRGGRTSVTPAAPSTVEVEGEVRYGSAVSVPSRLEDPATVEFTIVLLASEEPARIARLIDGIRGYAPGETAVQVVVVANDPSEPQQAALAELAASGPVPEQLRTSTRLGYAAALNIGLRRAAGEIVILADGSCWPAGNALSPIAAAFADDTVAAVGGMGFAADEPGRLRPAALELSIPAEGAASADTTALQGGWVAFRRSDLASLGPLDEHFVTPAWLDVWWSLRLRCGVDPDWTATDSDAAADRDANAEGDTKPAPTEPTEPTELSEEIPALPVLPAPRRAVLLSLPLEHDEIAWPPDRSRLNRRNMYRILDRFGWREDLA